MAVRAILPLTDPLLRQKALPIDRFDPALRRLVADLLETLHNAEGAGLAAPQIGQSLRVFVAEFEDEEFVLINPAIVQAAGRDYATEGCLSLPGYVGERIRRATRVAVAYQDVRGRVRRMVAEDWLARILQHEIDHLDGILFTDHLERPGDLRPVPPGTEADEPQEPDKAEARQRQRRKRR